MRKFVLHSVLLGLLGFLAACPVRAQITLGADGPGNTYELIESVLGAGTASEVPDCGDPGFGRHITEDWDDQFGKYVFTFHLHVTPDNDRCLTNITDRQRNEIKTFDGSPAYLKGYYGETCSFRWFFKLDSGFQPSPKFTHIHQIKAVGGLDSDSPIITITPRAASPDQLEIIYVAPTAFGGADTAVATANLSNFKGQWIEVQERALYATNGTYGLVLKRASDGVVLLAYTNNNLNLWRDDATFNRPKWGIYRSLVYSNDLRDEAVRFADFCLTKGTDTWSNSPPSLTTSPTDQTVLQGQNVSFTAVAGGTAPLRYRWRLNTTNLLAGATNATLTIANVQNLNSGSYTVVVTNSYGSVTSAVATLTVAFPPAITNQPASQVVTFSDTATFTVGVTGTAPLAYRWWINATNDLGATNSSLVVTNVQAANAGNYSVVVTNGYGAVTSMVATLSLIVTSTKVILDDRWLDGTRTNTSLPTDSAWYANSASTLMAGTNRLIGVLALTSGGTLNWWTYFTTNAASPVQLSLSDTLRLTLAFTASGVNASNNSRGLRLGLYNSSGGTRTVGDGANPNGANYAGFILDMNFGQTFGGSTTMLFQERTNLASAALINTTTATYAAISSSGGPATGSPGFSDGVPYTLQLLVQRNSNSVDLTATFSNTNGWSTSLTGTWTDTKYFTSAFDTFVIRAATNGLTATNFTFTEFKVELMAINNHPPVPGTNIASTSQNQPLTIPLADVLANATDVDGDALTITAVGSLSTNNVSVRLTNASILYPTTAGYVGADQISYTLTDYRGASTTGYVTVTVHAAVPPVLAGAAMAADRSSFTLTGTGGASQEYILWTTASLLPPATWTPIATNNADVNGGFSFTDSQTTNYAQRFYRVGTP